MFENLRTVIVSEGFSFHGFSEILGISEKTLSNKLNGITEFTLTEARKISSIFNKYSSEFLFKQKEG